MKVTCDSNSWYERVFRSAALYYVQNDSSYCPHSTANPVPESRISFTGYLTCDPATPDMIRIAQLSRELLDQDEEIRELKEKVRESRLAGILLDMIDPY
jgi:hypothetical protein